MYKIYVRQHLPWHRRNSPSSEFSILNRPQVAYLGLSSPKLAFFEPLIDILEPPKYIFLMSKVIQIHLGHRPENGKFPSLIRPQFFLPFWPQIEYLESKNTNFYCVECFKYASGDISHDVVHEKVKKQFPLFPPIFWVHTKIGVQKQQGDIICILCYQNPSISWRFRHIRTKINHIFILRIPPGPNCCNMG